jgi:hypothetical protein
VDAGVDPGVADDDDLEIRSGHPGVLPERRS